MKTIVTCAFFLATLAAVSPPAVAAERPVIVELFTSQGCSSCPPADALLGELASQPGVLALAFHVDYWDRLGWKDPYSSATATARQRAYAAALSLRTVYTPQMVVDGQYDAVGSDRRAVAGAIATARSRAEGVTPILARDGETLHVSLPVSTVPGRVWVAAYDRRHTTRIGAGENGGRMLTEYNVVRVFEEIGKTDGAPRDFSVPLAHLGGAEAAAVLVQASDGRFVGAGTLALADIAN
jgi:hypothetical protein